MKPITILNPAKIVFGNDSFKQFINDIKSSTFKRIFLVTFPQIWPLLEPDFNELHKLGMSFQKDESIIAEPTVAAFSSVLKKAQDFDADCIVGIGGGSVLDVAKLIAVLADKKQAINEVFGIGKIKSRARHMICLPTTSGTGSEMSPNAILLDEADKLKKGIISPFLVPDASYIDPILTLSLPPAVTAATGLDAFTHCLEAYTNKFAHPVIDSLALEGIMLIGQNLEAAFNDAGNLNARTNLALGSMYGGMCLGPVNTAAVHALSYPLGSEYKIAHGLSNALLLPHIMRFNLPVCIEKYSRIALALGVEQNGTKREIALKGIERIIEISNSCNIPLRLSDIQIPEGDITKLAHSALTVQRLLVNNPREVTLDDAIAIYRAAY